MDGLVIDELLEKYKQKIEYIGIQHPILSIVKDIRNNTSDDARKLFTVEGIWAHQRLLAAQLEISCLFICPELIYSSGGVELAEHCLKTAQETFVISRKVYEKISDRDGPDGFISMVQYPNFCIDNMKLKKDSLIIVLDGLETPGNIGTILRTCDGAGVDAVFICNKRARITNPKLIKGSMGAIFTMPVIEFADVGSCAEWLKEHGFNIYLADTRAERTYKSFDYKGNTALVMGSERYGISGEWYSCSPQLLSIPMLGACDSLNVGVAASVIVYEIAMKRLQLGYWKETV